MKKTFLLTAAFAGMAALAFAQQPGSMQQSQQQQIPQQQQQAMPGQQTTGLPAADQRFIDKAAKGSLYGLELGKLGAQKSQNPQVKEFAETMVRGNQAMNTQLGSIAERKGISAVRPLDQSQRSKLQQLSQLSGPDFDRAFLNAALMEQQNSLAAFQREAQSGQDRQLQQFAANTIPTLQSHIASGQRAEQAVGGAVPGTRQG